MEKRLQLFPCNRVKKLTSLVFFMLSLQGREEERQILSSNTNSVASSSESFCAIGRNSISKASVALDYGEY